MALAEPPRDDLLSLFELTDPGGREEGLEAYLRRALEVCVDWFQASGATLFLKEEAQGSKAENEGGEPSGEFRLAARAGTDAKAPLGMAVREGEGIAGVALKTGEPMLVRDPFEHALLGGKVLRRRSDIGSSLVVPLQTSTLGMLGVLCLSRRQGEIDFSRKDLSAARSIAGQVTLAVANARLYAKARRALAIERELAEAKRMAEIGQMTAAIAHEIRNPLTGIRGAAQMIQALGGESAEFAEIIDEEIVKLDRLCSDFLEFARPFELQCHMVDLAELAARVVANHQSRFAQEGVDLTFASEPNLPKMNLDPLRIEQVLHNLLRNALQASGPGGHVEVRASREGVAVQDDGRGMSEVEKAGLFAPFFTTKASGTGLGMSVVKKIVEAHRGQIHVASKVGEGTAIAIVLPSEEGV